MRKSIVFAIVAALAGVGCTQEQPLTGSRLHPSVPAASPATSSAALAVPPGDPHAVDRGTTPSDYCVACHEWADDANSHPERVSYLIPAAGGGYLNPPDPAIVLREGVWMECSSCHDDGSAGFPRRTVLQDTCLGCHDKNSSVSPPFVSISSPADGATVGGRLTLTASTVGAVRTELWGGPSAYELELEQEVASGGVVNFEVVTSWGLPNGRYVFLVRGYDAAGANGSSSVTVTIANDLSIAIESPVAGTTVSGTFSVVARTTGASFAELYVAGSNWRTAQPVGDTVTFDLDTTLLQNGPTELAVRAYDATGSYESASTSVVVDNPHPLPVVRVQTPAENELVRGTIQVVAATTGAVGIAELWMLRAVGDGAMLATAPLQADGSAAFSLDTAAYADDRAILSVRVHDAWGGSSFGSVSPIFDNTGPAVALTSPPPGGTIKATTTIGATASDLHGVASVAFYVDGALLGTAAAPPYAISWTPVRRSGSHTLTSVATDEVGNASTSAPVIVDAR